MQSENLEAGRGVVEGGLRQRLLRRRRGYGKGRAGQGREEGEEEGRKGERESE